MAGEAIGVAATAMVATAVVKALEFSHASECHVAGRGRGRGKGWEEKASKPAKSGAAGRGKGKGKGKGKRTQAVKESYSESGLRSLKRCWTSSWRSTWDLMPSRRC